MKLIKKAGFILAILFTTMSIKAQSVAGDWKGTLSVQGINLEIIFHITDEDGELAGTMDVPAQGATGIPVDVIELNGNEIKLGVSLAQITYKGELTADSISGVYQQAGMSLDLTLKRYENRLPGNTDLVSTDEELKSLIAYDEGDYKYSVADYFARPNASSFQLSPNGKYMSYMEKDGLKNHVYIKDLATEKVVRVIEEREEPIKGYGWINDERLFYMMDNGGNENYHIYAADIDGANVLDLTPFDGVRAGIVSLLKEQKDYIIISMNRDNPQVFEPFKLNVVTGELEKLYENDDPANPIQGYDFDKDGNLRGYTRMVNGIEMEFYYKNSETDEFELKKKTNWDDSFSIISFNYNTPYPDDAYIVTNLDSDKTRIVLYDLKNDKEIEELFNNAQYDVSGMGLSRKRNYEIDYFSFEGERSEIIPVSNLYKEIHEGVKNTFPGKIYRVVDFDDDENKFLIILQSDRLYGTYYEYDVKSKEFTLLYDLMPQLKEEDMAEMRPISFKSRDGLTIHGYITLPKEAQEGKKVPMVVNPHGGPQGIRDSWGFNPETQLFASRGYATLQVNFRISGGYGKEFLRAGFKQIGRKVMDDVEDGVLYAISQGWVDKDKIAIYGGSHGGYATLMGLVNTPELYTCGVNYVGVSNIETFFSSFPEYWKPLTEMVKEIWYDLDDPEEKAIAREVSPVYRTDRIIKPVYVVQGANDPRVNINESDQIVTALREKGLEIPYMVKYNEGHGFFREENRMDFYSTMLGFLAKYLK